MKKRAISCLTKCLLMNICATTKQYQKSGMWITTNLYHNVTEDDHLSFKSRAHADKHTSTVCRQKHNM